MSETIPETITETIPETISEIISETSETINNLTCEACNKTYSNFQNLNKHKKNVCFKDPKTEYLCDICEKEFTTEYKRNVHVSSSKCKDFKDKMDRMKNQYENIIDEYKKELEVSQKEQAFYKVGFEKAEERNKAFQISLMQLAIRPKIIHNTISNNQPIIKGEDDDFVYECELCDSTFPSLSMLEKHQTIGCDAPYKKGTISSTLKRLVWNEYIGENIGKSKCVCCKTTDIVQISFNCGHVVAERNGGETEIGNLRPICQNCNSSMGTKNMFDFMNCF